MKTILTTALTALALAATSSAYAMRMTPPSQMPNTDLKAPQQAGILSCTIDRAADRHATCAFQHSAGANSFRETYDTKLTRSLIDQSAKSATLMRWAVYTPGGEATPGMLLGAKPSDALQADDGATSSVKISYEKGGQHITFRQIGDDVTASNGKPPLEFTPSAEPLQSPKESVQITVIH